MKLLSENILKTKFNDFLKILHTKYYTESYKYQKRIISCFITPSDEIYFYTKYLYEKLNNGNKINIDFLEITYTIKIDKNPFNDLYCLKLISINSKYKFYD